MSLKIIKEPKCVSSTSPPFPLLINGNFALYSMTTDDFLPGWTTGDDNRTGKCQITWLETIEIAFYADFGVGSLWQTIQLEADTYQLTYELKYPAGPTQNFITRIKNANFVNVFSANHVMSDVYQEFTDNFTISTGGIYSVWFDFQLDAVQNTYMRNVDLVRT